jgi:FkbM family methyltransferase
MAVAALSLSKQVGPTGTVMAFEPGPENLALLHARVAAHHISNIRIFDCAASNQCSEAVIKMTNNLSTASLVWHTHDPSASKFKVKTKTIEHLVRRKEIREAKFVKPNKRSLWEHASASFWRNLARGCLVFCSGS